MNCSRATALSRRETAKNIYSHGIYKSDIPPPDSRTLMVCSDTDQMAADLIKTRRFTLLHFVPLLLQLHCTLTVAAKTGISVSNGRHPPLLLSRQTALKATNICMSSSSPGCSTQIWNIIPLQMEVAPLYCTVDITQKRRLFKKTKEIEKM